MAGEAEAESTEPINEGAQDTGGHAFDALSLMSSLCAAVLCPPQVGGLLVVKLLGAAVAWEGRPTPARDTAQQRNWRST